jgi:Skp family chaperone for outer membrane proteins
MKKLSALIIVSLFALTSLAIAAPEGEQGAADEALKCANDQAVFNRIPDWFATVGKSAEEKEKIMAEKKALRTQKRADKEAKKAEKQARKEAQKAEKEAEKAMEKAKDDADEAGKEMKKGFAGLKEKMKMGK